MKPGVDQADVDGAALGVLREYLQTFRPSQSEGLFTERDGVYSLHTNDAGLHFFLYNPQPWQPSDKVMVLRKNCFDDRGLKLKIAELDRSSSFVHGRLEELVDYDEYLVMRRYYKE